MKTTFIATLLLSAASVSFAATPTTPATATNQDLATYKSVTQQVAADYKAAAARCAGMSGNARAICKEDAKAARAHARADAIAKYNHTPKSHAKALAAAANADFALAKAKCADMSGADKEGCINNAHSVHVAAVADAKAGRSGAMVNATDDTRSATGVVNRSGSTATVIDNNRAGSQAGVDTARNPAGTANRAGENIGNRDGVVGQRAGAVVADSVITTKVKADIFKEPELKSMAIHVETEKGVVMLSGFVDSKAHADRAVQLAKEVEGVTNVKSAIKIK